MSPTFPAKSIATLFHPQTSTKTMDIDNADDANIDDDTPAPYAPPVDELTHLMQLCSDHVWGTPELRPMQDKIVRLMIDPAQPNAVLAVYRTGLGKSHVIRMLSALDRGICMVFIPLLTLSADVMSKFQSASQHFGSIRTYHLDELKDNNPPKYDAFLLSLIAANILTMEKNRSGDLIWNLCWHDNLTPVYKTDEGWNCINLRDEDSE